MKINGMLEVSSPQLETMSRTNGIFQELALFKPGFMPWILKSMHLDNPVHVTGAPGPEWAFRSLALCRVAVKNLDFYSVETPVASSIGSPVVL